MARDSTTIGLDIATSCVRAAELSRKGGTLRLRRFGQVPLPIGAVHDGEVHDPQTVGQAISRLWKAGRFTSKRVSIGVANQRVVVRHIEIPWTRPADRKTSLPLMVADQIPMPVDEAIMDFVPLGWETTAEGSRMSKGLLVAADENMVMQVVKAAQTAGLWVRDVDLSPFAVVRALCHADPLGLRSDAEAIVDIGASTTVIAIHANGIPHFVRILTIGGQDVTDRLRSELGVNLATAEQLKRDTSLVAGSPAGSSTAGKGSFDPARVIGDVVGTLVEEIRGSLDYYLATSSGARLSRVVLTGGGSLAPGFAERLRDAIHTPVERGVAVAALGVGETGLSQDHLNYADAMSAVCVGLAIGSRT
ncbi:MAG: type IV pilus assembly protein PilM [Candidatus Nanopelagicales bacterium]|nr:type IV pilus assembly protein PilM [Candidatus Nanopelagicales bacterium]